MVWSGPDLLDQAKEAIDLTQGWLVARTSRALRGAAWSVPFWRSEGTAHCVVFPLRFGTDRLTSSSQASKKKPKKRLLYRKTNLALQFPSCPLDATSTLRDGAYSINSILFLAICFWRDVQSLPILGPIFRSSAQSLRRRGGGGAAQAVADRD